MSERYTTARVASARPLGAPSVMAGIYTGAELANSSARPGAYDALRLPSLVSGRKVTREQMHAEMLAPLPPAPPMPTSYRDTHAADPDVHALSEEIADPSPACEAVGHAAQSASPQASPAYRPREGSGPHRLLQHLQQHGGHLTYSEISERFDIPSHSLTAIFKPALTRGALIQLRVGDKRRRALALPSYALAGDAHHASVAEAPVAPRSQLRNSQDFAASVAELCRAMETTSRLLMQFAAAFPSSH
ncbi:hypothetical protein WIX39_018855 [Variovorax sp. AB1(2024)]|uniref:hypothetical protein n=1 Tax=Variovorax sp. AB1(2024) TaxID=3132214 RepID=UPI0030AE3BFD